MIEPAVDESNYAETDQSVCGLDSYATARSLLELTARGLKRSVGEHIILRIKERDDGLFDLVVLKRTN